MLTRRALLARTSATLGVALTGSVASAILSGCRSNPSSEWAPAFFTASEMHLLGAMADHLLPRTSTPGALDVQVDRFFDAFFLDYASPTEQHAFRAGLGAFDAECLTRFGGSFSTLAAEARDRVFGQHEASSPALAPTVWGAQLVESPPPPTFYRQFKQLALVGYFTSAQVGETVLAYDPIPGRFEGCIPLASVGKAWSL